MTHTAKMSIGCTISIAQKRDTLLVFLLLLLCCKTTLSQLTSPPNSRSLVDTCSLCSNSAFTGDLDAMTSSGIQCRDLVDSMLGLNNNITEEQRFFTYEDCLPIHLESAEYCDCPPPLPDKPLIWDCSALTLISHVGNQCGQTSIGDGTTTQEEKSRVDAMLPPTFYKLELDNECHALIDASFVEGSSTRPKLPSTNLLDYSNDDTESTPILYHTPGPYYRAFCGDDGSIYFNAARCTNPDCTDCDSNNEYVMASDGYIPGDKYCYQLSSDASFQVVFPTEAPTLNPTLFPTSAPTMTPEQEQDEEEKDRGTITFDGPSQRESSSWTALKNTPFHRLVCLSLFVFTSFWMLW